MIINTLQIVCIIKTLNRTLKNRHILNNTLVIVGLFLVIYVIYIYLLPVKTIIQHF